MHVRRTLLATSAHPALWDVISRGYTLNSCYSRRPLEWPWNVMLSRPESPWPHPDDRDCQYGSRGVVRSGGAMDMLSKTAEPGCNSLHSCRTHMKKQDARKFTLAS